MLPIDDWLSGRNLPKREGDAPVRLEGEALAYALVSYIVRPDRLPKEVIVALAEDFFGKFRQDSEAY